MKINEMTILKFIIVSILAILAIKVGYEATIFVSDNIESLRYENRQKKYAQEQAEKREINKRILQVRIREVYNNCQSKIFSVYAGQISPSGICNCTVDCVINQSDADYEISDEGIQYCFEKCFATMGQFY